MTPPTISVVIPVRNEAAKLAMCLEGILSQTVPVLEILVIDSGSTDGTQDIVRSYTRTRLIEIPGSEFNHGDTRNLGVREAKGEFILFTVGDAWAVDERWIERLLSGFVADDIAVVSGAQVVAHRADTSPLEWFRPVSTPKLSIARFDTPAAYDAATPNQKHAACAIDDVNALYRRGVLEKIPFRRVVYGEDVLFAIDAFRSGYAIARHPGARVYHWHLDNYDTTLKRTVTVGILRHALFGTLPEHTEEKPLRIGARLLRERSVPMAAKLRWWRHRRELDRAITEGVALVRRAAADGPDALAALHDRFGGTPPVPLKRQAGAAP
ncbi:hypothetical protein C1J05_06060 [Sulfitobacter sp. JL08]|uniref:glycosyltransferase family 2 protein n=1 Tax=Sulfitobacter sp. JL08 TaxID=2070369 RepID=UPI000E0C0B2C|nr:glycosyltransferase [Sulfitobacter sp. JL08]AXI54111.1 hypothetical protein C1J05_06060 [Sulfitobacter sp. JL08]